MSQKPGDYGVTKTKVTAPKPAPPLSERELLEKIISKLDAITPIPSTFNTGQLLVVAAGIAQNLPPRDIPFGYQVVVKALPTNVPAGVIQVGSNKPDSENVANNYPLAPNEAIALRVSNLSAIWFTGPAGDGIAWIVEQK